MADIEQIGAGCDHELDIRSGRLSAEEYTENFSDMYAPLNRKQALIESNRCYFCYDAPCIEACPTAIDIPSFIQKISTDNVKGSAEDILTANIMGGSCARVCPVEDLCEEACVRNTENKKPVKISQLQRYATDGLFARDDAQIFERAPETGKTVAVVGGGPAGLSCAHKLATFGHNVTVLEARPKSGGLNEYGIAAYKETDDFAQKEVDYILSIGGIEMKNDQALGKDFSLDDLRKEYDAVFLGIGHSGVNALGLENEDLNGVGNAVDYIAELRQADDLADVEVGRRVVVVGGGNTAVDIAVQTKLLGAEDVTLVYRRGVEQMGATDHEQEYAQINGVKIKHWAKPSRLVGANGNVREIEFEYTELNDEGRLVGKDEYFTLQADMVFKAIGQKFEDVHLETTSEKPKLTEWGRLDVDENGQTSLPDVWAGGDCIEGEDLTVQAVEDGKIAAVAIDKMLKGEK